MVCTGLSFPFGMMAPNWVIGFVRRRYQKQLRRGIPDALDLMVVCAQSGLGLETAIERVAAEIKHTNKPVGLEFSLLSYEMRILPDRRMALMNFGERSGQEALRRLGGTLAQTLKYGTPLSQSLRVLAAEMRNDRLMQFEERAARLPALLVLPMVMFILPCLFIILVGPSVVQLLASIHG
jgi:tight adherence protein C